jgi:hypothetical protein
MTSGKNFLGSAFIFFLLAVVFSVTIWPEASLAAKIAFFTLGLGSGVMLGQYLARRKAQ